MANPIQIRMGGYGPPTTGFSKSMKFIGDRLEKQFGDRIDVKYCWNIMDFGYKAEEILWLVESGILTLGYQSSSYLTDRVPELSFVDLPFLFANNDKARGAMDGALGISETDLTHPDPERAVGGPGEARVPIRVGEPADRRGRHLGVHQRAARGRVHHVDDEHRRRRWWGDRWRAEHGGEQSEPREEAMPGVGHAQS